MESRILIGDCRTTLAELPAGSVQMCVTSPPYFALRSYLPKDHPDKALEIGSEPTIEAFIATMLDVFEAVRRVLRDDGTLWVNIGDSYCSNEKWGGGGDNTGKHVVSAGGDVPSWAIREKRQPIDGLKQGDQMLVPYRFALAMQAAGWYLRSTIIWRKLSPMPESIAGVRWRKCVVKTGGGWSKETHPSAAGRSGVFACDGTSPGRPGGTTWQPCPGCAKCLPNGGYVLRRGRWRPTQAHEPIFLFSKSERYFCDGDAVAEAASPNTALKLPHGRRAFTVTKEGVAGENRANGSMHAGTSGVTETRNPRSVMTFPAEPYKLAHFATYPSSLPAFCIRAGTSSAGCCPKCGACYAPVVESERVPTRPGNESKLTADYAALRDMSDELSFGNRDPQRHVAVKRVTGYRPTCNCKDAGPSVPCTVLDPFLGSGTTLQAAKALGRSGIGCELNEAYAAMAQVRIDTPPKWATTKPKRKRLIVHPSQLDLFAQ